MPNGSALDRSLPQVLEAQQHYEHPFELAIEMGPSRSSLSASSASPSFVYERVLDVTLKTIANNAEIDVIWDKWLTKLEPLRESLNAALQKTWLR